MLKRDNFYLTKKFQISRRTLLTGAALGAAGSVLSIPKPAIAGHHSSKVNSTRYGPAPGIAKLNANENPYGPSPAALKAMSEAIQKGAYYANESVAKLKSMIAERNGVSVDHIMITSGSSGAPPLRARSQSPPSSGGAAGWASGGCPHFLVGSEHLLMPPRGPRARTASSA